VRVDKETQLGEAKLLGYSPELGEVGSDEGGRRLPLGFQGNSRASEGEEELGLGFLHGGVEALIGSTGGGTNRSVQGNVDSELLPEREVEDDRESWVGLQVGLCWASQGEGKGREELGCGPKTERG
jgi:hypothetical protein